MNRRLTEDGQIMVENHLWLADLIAKRYFSRARDYSEQQDIRGASYLGLCKAGTTFRPELGFKFSTYAKWYCVREILQALADRKLIHAPRGRADLRIAPISRLANTADPSPGPVDQAELTEVWEAVTRLPEQERTVIELIRQGWTLEEIGAEIRVTRQRVHQIKQQAISRLSAQFADAS